MTMQVAVETLSNLERKLTITVPANEVEDKFTNRINQIAKSANINGFRPGKVPPSVIKKRFGQDVHNEIVEEVIKSSLQDALIKEDINPAGMNAVDVKEQNIGKDLLYTVLVEVFPEIEFTDLQDKSVEN